jgi:hypothetical protein
MSRKPILKRLASRKPFPLPLRNGNGMRLAYLWNMIFFGSIPFRKRNEAISMDGLESARAFPERKEGLTIASDVLECPDVYSEKN